MRERGTKKRRAGVLMIGYVVDVLVEVCEDSNQLLRRAVQIVPFRPQSINVASPCVLRLPPTMVTHLQCAAPTAFVSSSGNLQ